MIEAIGTIFAINRFLRGQIKFEDPQETIAITEVFGMVALSNAGKDGPIMAVSIEEDELLSADPDYIRSEVIPDLLVNNYDYVYHIFDASVADITQPKERSKVIEAISLGELACVDQIASVIGVLYEPTEIICKTLSSIDECVAFYRKNIDSEFPNWKLPNNIAALWQMVSAETIKMQSEDPVTFKNRMEKATSDLHWN